jgi:hypothetical protein
MKCPTCGAWSIVKETKDSPTFGYKRRRECANEHKFTTQEVVIPQEALEQERRDHIKANHERLESVRALRRAYPRRASQNQTPKS